MIIPGQIVLEADVARDGKYGPHFEGMATTCQHGWPCTFLVREPVPIGTPPSSSRLSLWDLSDGVVSPKWLNLIIDIATGFLALLSVGIAFKRWRRRRRRLLQFYLSELLLVVLLVSGVLS